MRINEKKRWDVLVHSGILVSQSKRDRSALTFSFSDLSFAKKSFRRKARKVEFPIHVFWKRTRCLERLRRHQTLNPQLFFISLSFLSSSSSCEPDHLIERFIS